MTNSVTLIRLVVRPSFTYPRRLALEVATEVEEIQVPGGAPEYPSKIHVHWTVDESEKVRA